MCAATTRAMVATLKEHDEDMEWFPTTDAMIDVIKKHMEEHYADESPSVLDCGAGDGRVLNALTTGNKYAIEKSTTLLNVLGPDIFVVGTNMHEQTLIDKSVDITYSSPPYSEYAIWMTKIIKEANCGDIYLIVPDRWKDNNAIQIAIEERQADVTVLDTQDFLSADRAARARVDILHIALRYRGRYSGNRPIVDPFKLWFDSFFSIAINEEKASDHEARSKTRQDVTNKVKQEMVAGGDLISTLELLYQRDMANLMKTYKALEDIDPVVLNEMNVDLDGVKKSLQLKISSLKDVYWHELFDNFDTITDRLTARSREVLLGTLTKHTHVDFSVSNALAIIGWVIKNVNQYVDQQLSQMVETLTQRANIKLYKSNQKAIRDEGWRYGNTPEDLDHYGLDYRIVLEWVGGLHTDYGNGVNGLSERCARLFDDLCAVATNLGFDTYKLDKARDFEWGLHVKNTFRFRNLKTGTIDTLFDAKAFKNGNAHIRFNQKFIRRLNVVFGQLKGWIKSPKEAAEELDIPLDEAMASFNANRKLTHNDFLQLGCDCLVERQEQGELF